MKKSANSMNIYINMGIDISRCVSPTLFWPRTVGKKFRALTVVITDNWEKYDHAAPVIDHHICGTITFGTIPHKTIVYD